MRLADALSCGGCGRRLRRDARLAGNINLVGEVELIREVELTGGFGGERLSLLIAPFSPAFSEKMVPGSRTVYWQRFVKPILLTVGVDFRRYTLATDICF